MLNTFDRIQRITLKDCKRKTIFELLTSTTEEIGELARELLIEECSFGNNYKSVDEGSKAEAVDLLICAAAIFFARGGNIEELEGTLNKKLSKWEKNQDEDSSVSKVKTVLCQRWEESERGWGCRPDGYSLHISETNLQKFIKEHEKYLLNTYGHDAPYEYSRPEGESYEISVDKETYEKVQSQKFGLRSFDKAPSKEKNEEK